MEEKNYTDQCLKWNKHNRTGIKDYGIFFCLKLTLYSSLQCVKFYVATVKQYKNFPVAE